MLFFFLISATSSHWLFLLFNIAHYLRHSNLAHDHLGYVKAWAPTLHLLRSGRLLILWLPHVSTLSSLTCCGILSRCSCSLLRSGCGCGFLLSLTCYSLIRCIRSKSVMVVTQIACFTDATGVEPTILMVAQLRHLIATLRVIAILAHAWRVIVLLRMLTLRNLLTMLNLPLAKVIGLPSVLAGSLHTTHATCSCSILLLHRLLLLLLDFLLFFRGYLSLLSFLQFFQSSLLATIWIFNHISCLWLIGDSLGLLLGFFLSAFPWDSCRRLQFEIGIIGWLNSNRWTLLIWDSWWHNIWADDLDCLCGFGWVVILGSAFTWNQWWRLCWSRDLQWLNLRLLLRLLDNVYHLEGVRWKRLRVFPCCHHLIVIPDQDLRLEEQVASWTVVRIVWSQLLLLRCRLLWFWNSILWRLHSRWIVGSLWLCFAAIARVMFVL